MSYFGNTDTVQTAQNLAPTTTAINVAIANLNAYGGVAIQITGTWTGTLIFEGSVDGGTNWFTTPVIAINGSGVLVTTATANGQWQGDISGYSNFRVRCSVTGTGTAVVSIRGSLGEAAMSIDSPLPTGANTIGAVNIAGGQAVSLNPKNSGGATIYRLLSAATTNANNIVASAAQVYGWYIYNTSVATKFVKLYNKASSPTVGTDTPVITLPIPAGGGTNVDFANGVQFATGLSIAITGVVTDADTTAVALNDVIVNIFYK